MSNFLTATFPATATTDITSFTGDAGVTWTLVRGTISPKVFTAAGGIAANGGPSASEQIVRSNTIAPSTEVNTTVTFHYDSAIVNFVIGYTCRMSTDGSSGYLLAYSTVTQKWAVWRMTGGSGTGVAEIVAAATTSVYSSGNEPVVQFKVEGSGASVSITVIVDGTTLIDHFADTNAARITTAGYDGLYFLVDGAAGNGMWIKDISGDTISTGATTATAAWTEGAEVFALAGSVVVSGIAVAAAWTEGAETFAVSGTVSLGTTRTVTINLVAVAGTAIANLTGLKWAFFANVTPDLFVAPEAKGAVETTDASGVNVISFTSALAVGATGWLTITDSDGSATTIHNAFSGPVVVA